MGHFDVQDLCRDACRRLDSRDGSRFAGSGRGGLCCPRVSLSWSVPGRLPGAKGDTLASIVAAQLGQVHDLAATYDMIVAQNPHAFVQADPNRLIAGKVLTFGAGQHSGSRRDDIYFF